MAGRRKLRSAEHRVIHLRMIGFSCACGTSWRNDEMKGKDDADLMLESWQAFKRHSGKQ